MARDARISVAGPPRLADPPPRDGYRWLLPLSAKPPTAWLDRFEAVDWGALIPELPRAHRPRVRRAKVWIADLHGEALVRVLTAVADRVDEISRSLEAERQAAALEARRRPELRELRLAEDREAIARWWAARQAPSGFTRPAGEPGARAPV